MTDLNHQYRQTVSRRYVDRRTWSPAQLLAGIAGLFFIVLGGVALARLIPVEGLTAPDTQVWLFGHTPLLGMIELVLGLLFLGVAAGPFDARGGLVALGVVCLAFGLIVGIEPGAFAEWLGASRETGWLYGVVGAIAILGGWLSPVIVTDKVKTQDSLERTQDSYEGRELTSSREH